MKKFAYGLMVLALAILIFSNFGLIFHAMMFCGVVYMAFLLVMWIGGKVQTKVKGGRK